MTPSEYASYFMATADETRWMDDANCTGVATELFFPTKEDRFSMAEAKKVCAGCKVRKECGDYAQRHNIHYGIWGGRSDRDRRRNARSRHAEVG